MQQKPHFSSFADYFLSSCSFELTLMISFLFAFVKGIPHHEFPADVSKWSGPNFACFVFLNLSLLQVTVKCPSQLV
jgi:hypothetical protein